MNREGHKFDLIFMDIIMPKLDGVSATDMIRQFDSITPIISMTGNSTPSDIMNYYSHGAFLSIGCFFLATYYRIIRYE